MKIIKIDIIIFPLAVVSSGKEGHDREENKSPNRFNCRGAPRWFIAGGLLNKGRTLLGEGDRLIASEVRGTRVHLHVGSKGAGLGRGARGQIGEALGGTRGALLIKDKRI